MNILRADDQLHRRAGRQAALQDGPVGCTLRWAGGLHMKLGCGKGRVRGLPFSAACPALFCSPPNSLFVQPAGPPFCFLCSSPAHRKFKFFIWQHSPPGPPISVIRLGLGLGRLELGLG